MYLKKYAGVLENCATVDIIKAVETFISLSMVSFEADAETEFIEALNILYKAKHVYKHTLPIRFDR